MTVINVPKVETNDYGRAQFATEIAFNNLLESAKKQGLTVAPVMGLMYLPTQELTQNFKDACRAILLALTPKESHVIGSDGKEYWVGDGNVPA